eukprot:3548931-Rhodomonas_salina.1
MRYHYALSGTAIGHCASRFDADEAILLRVFLYGPTYPATHSLVTPEEVAEAKALAGTPFPSSRARLRVL